jgi:hypothetical protein
MQVKSRGYKEVTAFAEAMKYNLNLEKNMVKGDWKKEEWPKLLHFLRAEVIELHEECIRYQSKPTTDTQRKILLESADIACFALMVADKLGCLSVNVSQGGFYEKFVYSYYNYSRNFLKFFRVWTRK